MARDFTKLPKAEIHIHLEGCFEADSIVQLANEAGEPLPRPAERLFEFKDLSTFLGFLDWTCGLVRTPDQLTAAAYDFARRMQSSGARYADVIVNPSHWHTWQWRLREFIEALDRGFAAAEADGLPPSKLCISLLRQQSADEAIEIVDTLLEMKHPRVVALSIDGNETAAGRTGPRFAEAFRRAGAGGLKRTVHAGESSGPEGVWDAIELLGADRIDHGVRAIEDQKLVDLLVERQIPLDICPTSNLITHLYPNLESHPIEKFRKAGVPVSVNTDDPAYLGLRLDREDEKCAEAFGWDDAVVRQVAASSVNASYADTALKKQILAEILAW